MNCFSVICSDSRALAEHSRINTTIVKHTLATTVIDLISTSLFFRNSSNYDSSQILSEMPKLEAVNSRKNRDTSYFCPCGLPFGLALMTIPSISTIFSSLYYMMRIFFYYYSRNSWRAWILFSPRVWGWTGLHKPPHYSYFMRLEAAAAGLCRNAPIPLAMISL